MRSISPFGLDAAAIMSRIGDTDAKARLIANTELSVSHDAFGSPAFFLGDRMYFGKNRLRDLEASILGMA